MTSVAEQAEPGVVPQTSSLPLTYRRSGLAWALLSGACWGLDGVILGVALAAGQPWGVTLHTVFISG